MRRLTVLNAAVFGLVLLGCSSPVDDKPQATITDVEEPAAGAPTETDAPAEAASTVAKGPKAGQTEYAFTDNTYIGFAGSKPLGTHYGQFIEYDGSVYLEGEDLSTAEVNLTIDMTSTEVDDSRLTAVLKNENFFNVEEYPQATFVTTGIEHQEEDTYNVSGKLTLRGITKGVTFPATIELSDGVLNVTAEFSVDRNAWDVGKGYTGQTIIDDLVLIEIAAEAAQGSS